MKTAIYRRYGNPKDIIELADEEVRSPAEGEVVIEIEAAPIHLGDLYNMEGREGFRLPLPMVPGIEGIGRIIEINSTVTSFKVSDRVLFLSSSHVDNFITNQQGTWREQITLSSEILIPAPEGDAAQYANIVNPATAYVFIHDVTKPAQGEWIIQNAANSNVGRYLIKVANHYGCKTVNVVRRKELLQELEQLGGDAVVLDGPELAEEVREATKGAEIRFALDALAGEGPTRLGGCLINGGTVYNYGMVSKVPCQLPTWMMLNRDIRLQGFFAGTQLHERKEVGKKKLIRKLAGLINEGVMPAKIAGRYPLSKVKDAVSHAADSGSGRDGKVILLPNG